MIKRHDIRPRRRRQGVEGAADAGQLDSQSADRADVARAVSSPYDDE
jgi:hypothetical protein